MSLTGGVLIFPYANFFRFLLFLFQSSFGSFPYYFGSFPASGIFSFIPIKDKVLGKTFLPANVFPSTYFITSRFAYTFISESFHNFPSISLTAVKIFLSVRPHPKGHFKLLWMHMLP